MAVTTLAALATLAPGSRSTAAAAPERPLLGILYGQQRTVARPGAAIQNRFPTGTLVRLDPRTLRPRAGARVNLPAGSLGHALSPDGARLATATSTGARLRLVELSSMRSLGDIVVSAAPHTNVRALAWLRSDRLLALVQRMGGPYKRQVVARTLSVIDPAARRVIARHALQKTAVSQTRVAGERLVLVQADSNQRSPRIRLVVADASGAVRSREFAVGPAHGPGMRAGFGLALTPSGQRAFLAVSFGRMIEIDLDTLVARERRPRLASRAPQLLPPVWSLTP